MNAVSDMRTGRSSADVLPRLLTPIVPLSVYAAFVVPMIWVLEL